MLQHGGYSGWQHGLVFTDLINVLLTVKVNDDLVTIFKQPDVREGTRLSVGESRMGRERGIALMCWEGCSIQPAGIAAQPLQIPILLVFAKWYAHNIELRFQLWDLQP